VAFPTISGFPVEFAFYVTFACVYALLALGLNIQWGQTGLFNAGVAAFYAVGAYVTAILITAPAPPVPGVYPGHLGGFSQNWLVALPISALVAGGIGFLIAIPTLRLRTDYLAIATLGLGEVIRLILLNDAPLTGGTVGIFFIPKLFADIPGMSTGLQQVLIAGVGILVVVLAFLILWYIGRSPWSRVLKSIREDEDAAEVLGKDTFSFKLQSFVLGCMLMGAAGSVFTVFLVYIEPIQTFAPIVTFTVWAMLMLGGSGNNKGAILGAFLFYFIDWETTRIQIQLSGTTGIPSVTPILPPLTAFAVAVLPFIALNVAVILGVRYLPLLRRRIVLTRRRWISLGLWGIGEGILAWVLYYSFLHPNYLSDKIVYFRIMLVGLILILVVVYRPQGLLPEKLLTVRRRSP
jgi:branched-chain amino acid transport system permease protein